MIKKDKKKKKKQTKNSTAKWFPLLCCLFFLFKSSFRQAEGRFEVPPSGISSYSINH